MKEMMLYHGSTVIVEYPICKLGRKNLDFGQGFYLTALRRLSEHQPNNQICMLSQELTDKYLVYDGTEAI